MKKSTMNDFIEALTKKKGTSAYDTQAEVVRVDGSTAWVHIPGGVDETPVRMTINAKPGDTVQVRVGGGRAWLTGNGSAPPTDDTRAIAADTKAGEAKQTAKEAYEYADIAKEAADNAVVSAGVAKQAADNSLLQLSIVEDVAGTLNWISEHGSYVASTDTAVNLNTVYFELVSGDYVPIVNPDPTANPSTEGWYVLDVTDSQAEYIMAHLAVTSAGLWVLPAGQFTEYQIVDNADNELVDDASNLFVAFSSDPQRATGYKVLLSATGMTVFDDTGTAVAVYADTVTIGATSGNNVHIDSSKVAVRDGLTELAEFGATSSRIGIEDEQHIVIDSDSVEFMNGEDKLATIEVDSENHTAINFGNFRDNYGNASSYLEGDTMSSSNGTSSHIMLRSYQMEDNPSMLSTVGLSSTHVESLNSDSSRVVINAMNGVDIAQIEVEVSSAYSPRIIFEGESQFLGDIISRGDITAPNFYTSNGKIGERVSSEPSAVSTGSGKYYQAGSLSLTAGMWLIICAAEYASAGGATGVRRSWVVNQAFTDGTTTEPSGGQGYTFNDRRAGIASNPVDTHGQGILNITADTTLRQVVYQNSGTSVNVTGRMYAVRIA